MCLYFFLGTQNCSCSKLWLVLCSNQHLALRRVWRRDIMHTRLLSSLAFSWLFRGWAVHVSVSCVGVCLTHSRCYCVWVHLRVYLHFYFHFFFCSNRILVARPRSTLCRIYYYTPTPYTYKASAFSPHVTRAGSCVPQREVPL